MAALPLIASTATSLEELVQSLEPNTLPTEPSIWPLALGYWLVFLAIALLVVGLGWYWRKTKLRRSVFKQLNILMRISDPQQASIQFHSLFRWTLQTLNLRPASINNRDLEVFISDLLNSPTPAWVNAHYKPKPTSIDWNDAERLLNKLFEEAAR